MIQIFEELYAIIHMFCFFTFHLLHALAQLAMALGMIGIMFWCIQNAGIFLGLAIWFGFMSSVGKQILFR